MKHSRTQIVATLGPATHDKRIIHELIMHQVDVVRLNFSWGTHEDHAHYIKTVREVAVEEKRRIPIIQDLSGPRVQESSGHHFAGGAGEALTVKDLEDLKFGIAQGVEYVAMSYVGGADDIKKLKLVIKAMKGRAKVIAKIERQVAIDKFAEILKVSDAIMIARGDMGNEVPLEQIPFVEHDLIVACKKAKKPVITATQMLVSMVESPTPTRAEVTDIAYAIIAGSDAVMLSEETARGKYPVEAVSVMERVSVEAESHHVGKLRINRL